MIKNLCTPESDAKKISDAILDAMNTGRGELLIRAAIDTAMDLEREQCALAAERSAGGGRHQIAENIRARCKR